MQCNLLILYWPEAELNCRHENFQSSALPTELSGRARALIVLELAFKVNTISQFQVCDWAQALKPPSISITGNS